jgi:hypothetical protein
VIRKKSERERKRKKEIEKLFLNNKKRKHKIS